MPIFDLYSRRKKHAEHGETPEVYSYDDIPRTLRVQIIGIWQHAIGPYKPPRYSQDDETWGSIHDIFAHEKGLFDLSPDAYNSFVKCKDFLLESQSIDDCLDIIEFTFGYIDTFIREHFRNLFHERCITQDPDDAISELNFRLREAGVGYQFENGMIARVDSQFIHSEVTRPMLQLINDPLFAGAQEEFLSAHGHYRAGKHKEAIVDALKAFESTLKSICDAKGWKYSGGARATDLIKIVQKENLFPNYLDKSFDQLIATLQSGLPAVRNEEGGHGQGSTPKETPGYIAAYALHLTAANIVLLVEAFKHSQDS